MSEPSENSSAVQPTVPIFEVAFQKGMWWSIPAEMSQAIYEKYRLYKQEWQIAGGRMVTALKIYETKWQEVLNNERSFPVLNSLEGRKPSAPACPHVASMLDSLDTETLDWLTETYLWDKLAKYGRSDDECTQQPGN